MDGDMSDDALSDDDLPDRMADFSMRLLGLLAQNGDDDGVMHLTVAWSYLTDAMHGLQFSMDFRDPPKEAGGLYKHVWSAGFCMSARQMKAFHNFLGFLIDQLDRGFIQIGPPD
jgi:hypothetical protein